MLKLLGLGTPVLDLFAKVDDAFLKKWELEKGSTNFVSDTRIDLIRHALGDRMAHEQPGDNARNLCDAYSRLRHLQLQPESMAGYAGSVGEDATGKKILDSLQKAGVSPYLSKKKGLTGQIACLITPEGQRTFAAHLGVGEDFSPDEPLPSSDVFFVTSISALCEGRVAAAVETHIQRCAQEGIQLAVSLESPNMLALKRKRAILLARKADLLFLNSEEMAALGLGEKEAAGLAHLVFVKKGAGGSSVFEGGRKMGDVPAVKVEKVVDTTGAGDVYAAGVLAALAQGQTPMQAAQLGAKSAAAAVGRFGGGLPDDFKL